MTGIPPSERISKELHALLHGATTEGNVLSAVLRKAAERIIQEALEEELKGHLGRDRYERAESAASALAPQRGTPTA